MSDLDQLRAELRAAVAPPYDIRPASDLGPALRRRARRHRRVRYAAVVAAAAVCAILAVAAGTTLAEDAKRTAPPAKSGDLQSPPAISLPSAPHRLDTPVQVREVIGTPPCGTVEGALESVDGGSCFQIAPPELVARRVADLAVTVDRGQVGPADDRVVLVLTLEPDQERRYIDLITPACGRSAVLVVVGLVYSSPRLGDERPDGKMRLTATGDGAVEQQARLLTSRPAPGLN